MRRQNRTARARVSQATSRVRTIASFASHQLGGGRREHRGRAATVGESDPGAPGLSLRSSADTRTRPRAHLLVTRRRIVSATPILQVSGESVPERSLRGCRGMMLLADRFRYVLRHSKQRPGLSYPVRRRRRRVGQPVGPAAAPALPASGAELYARARGLGTPKCVDRSDGGPGEDGPPCFSCLASLISLPLDEATQTSNATAL
jgi:hypothetical protein